MQDHRHFLTSQGLLFHLIYFDRLLILQNIPFEFARDAIFVETII